MKRPTPAQTDLLGLKPSELLVIQDQVLPSAGLAANREDTPAARAAPEPARRIQRNIVLLIGFLACGIIIPALLWL